MWLINPGKCLRRQSAVPIVTARLATLPHRWLSQDAGHSSNNEGPLKRKLDRRFIRSLDEIVEMIGVVSQTQGKYSYENIKTNVRSTSVAKSRYGWRGKPSSDVVWFANQELFSDKSPQLPIDGNPLKDAMGSFFAFCKARTTLRIHISSYSQQHYVAIAALEPSRRLCRTQVLGSTTFEPDIAHPRWQGSFDYRWSSIAGMFYSVLQAVELAATIATSGQQVVVCLSRFELLQYRQWQQAMLYSQLIHLHSRLDSLRTGLIAKDVNLIFHLVPLALAEQNAVEEATKLAAMPKVPFGAEEPNFDVAVDDLKFEYHNPQFPSSLRVVAQELLKLNHLLESDTAEHSEEEKRSLLAQRLALHTQRKHEIKDLNAPGHLKLPHSRTEDNMTRRQLEWYKADYLWRKHGNTAVLSAFNKKFSGSRDFTSPPPDLAPPYPQPHVDTRLSWDRKTGSLNRNQARPFEQMTVQVDGAAAAREIENKPRLLKYKSKASVRKILFGGENPNDAQVPDQQTPDQQETPGQPPAKTLIRYHHRFGTARQLG